MPKRVFSYDLATGIYLGEGTADESPLEPGVYLLPANSTEAVPPPAGAHEAQVFRGDAWALVPDWRGRVYWLADRTRHEITELGISPPVDALDEEPPLPPDVVKAAKWEEIKAERDWRSQQSGFQCAAKWFHSDTVSKTQHLGNKDTARDQLAAGGAMADALVDPVTGENIVWKTMDGTWQPLTCQLAFDIVKAGKGAEFAHYREAEAHRIAMEQSADPANYDYSGGWPAAFGDPA